MNETQLAVTELPSELAEKAVINNVSTSRIEEHPAWPAISQFPVLLTLGIQLNRIKIRDLLRLDKGQVLESSWPQTSDVSVAVAKKRLCWAEFEVSGQQIGVRVTQLI